MKELNTDALSNAVESSDFDFESREAEQIKEVMRLSIQREKQGSNARMIKLMEEVADELGCTVVDIKVAMMSQSLVPIFNLLGL